jgi:predicted AAA+ superfamily ATPase
MIQRSAFVQRVQQSLAESRITALLGPRQCGKTTLARQFRSAGINYFDLESPLDLARLNPDPLGLLGSLEGLIVIDEIQEMQSLFPILRILADEPVARRQFLILGSASPDLLKHSAETLAGRIRFIELGGFDIREIGLPAWETLWLRGGFPESFLAPSDASSRKWLEDFTKTYISRDLPRLAETRLTPLTLHRLLTMIAHCHGQVWNHAKIATSLQIDAKTVKRHMDIFVGSYVVRQLQPYLTNIGKRLVKSPKVYVRDSGLLHSLLRIGAREELLSHPCLGHSWEGFALEQVLRTLDCSEHDCFFWQTQAGAEIDLVIPRGGRLYGFEFKYSGAPSTTKSMHVALNDLGLRKILVIYPGSKSFSLGQGIEALAFPDLERVLEITH